MFKLFKEINEIKEEGRRERKRINDRADEILKQIEEDGKRQREEIEKGFKERKKILDELNDYVSLNQNPDAKEIERIVNKLK